MGALTILINLVVPACWGPRVDRLRGLVRRVGIAAVLNDSVAIAEVVVDIISGASREHWNNGQTDGGCPIQTASWSTIYTLNHA